jgi:hypothetical protein
MLLPGKPDLPVWGFGPSGFSVSEPYCPTGGRHVRNAHLLDSSLCSQDSQQVLTIPGGRSSVVEPMVHTTLPKVDKAGISSVEIPMAQALVARLGSKAPDDNLADDDLDLLNFVIVKFEIVYWMSFWL